MVEALITAMIIIAILAIVGWVLTALIPLPPPAHTIVWAIIAIIALVIVYRAISGHGLAL